MSHPSPTEREDIYHNPTPTISAPKAETAQQVWGSPEKAATVAQSAPPLPTEAITANTTDFSYPPPTTTSNATTAAPSQPPPHLTHAPVPTPTTTTSSSSDSPVGTFTGPSITNPYIITGANVEATNAPGSSAALPKPHHKLTTMTQKFVGTMEVGLGKVLHNEKMVEKGHAKKEHAGGERQRRKEHKFEGGDQGNTGLKERVSEDSERHDEGGNHNATGRYY
ncbi:hypothetical protein HDV00_006422 [Rhizophlyctis rosea]|nr:hypothetical protein HDV00_006422 [Rhizophlyctis rosea]